MNKMLSYESPSWLKIVNHQWHSMTDTDSWSDILLNHRSGKRRTFERFGHSAWNGTLSWWLKRNSKWSGSTLPQGMAHHATSGSSWTQQEAAMAKVLPQSWTDWTHWLSVDETLPSCSMCPITDSNSDAAKPHTFAQTHCLQFISCCVSSNELLARQSAKQSANRGQWLHQPTNQPTN